MALIDTLDRKIGPRKTYYLAYTIVFAILCLLVFAPFYLEGKLFIWYHDGLRQHLTSLAYFGEWLRDVVSGPFRGEGLQIPTFSFAIGYGGDIIGTLNYYCIGDPLNLLSAFVPMSHTPYLYSALVIVRLFLAGISFSAYVKYVFDAPRAGSLAGALVYAFCGFALYAGVRHPYFLNPLIYFPLILLGIERIIRQRKPDLFVVSIAVSAASNFYFFYMLFLLMALYIVMRIVVRTRQIGLKAAAADFGWIFGFGVVGALISCAVFLPSALYFLQDTRSATKTVIPLFYEDYYYTRILLDIMTAQPTGNWTRLSYVAPCFMALLLLFTQRKQYTQLKVALVFLLACLLVPFAGHVFNGMSYVANRWCWAFTFAVACTFAVMWDKLTHLSAKGMAALGAVAVAYLLFACYMNRIYNEVMPMRVMFAVGLACIVVTLACSGINLLRSRKRDARHAGATGQGLSRPASALCLCVVAAGIAFNGYVYYNADAGNYADEFLDIGTARNNMTYEARSVAKLEDDAFARYTTSPTLGTSNAGLLSGLSSTKLYWSLCNGNVKRYFYEMGIDASSHAGNVWRDLNSLTYLNELAGVKYYLSPTSELRPYGYAVKPVDKDADSHNEFRIYENETPLPFGYTYGKTLSAEDFQALAPAQRREALMQACLAPNVKDSAIEAASTGGLSLTSVEVPFQISPKKNVEKDGNSFEVSKNDSKVRIECEGLPNAETFLEFTELTRDSSTDLLNIGVTFHFADGTKQKRTLDNTSPNYSSYQHHRWQTVCAGYSESPVTAIDLEFPRKTTYHYEDLKVISQPMDNYTTYVDTLKAGTLEQVDLHYLSKRTAATSHVTGTISLDAPKMLCTQIPFSAGWHVRVDGAEAPVQQINVMFTGVELDSGDHKVEFYYETPGLKLGIGLALLGFMAYIAFAIVRRKRA